MSDDFMARRADWMAGMKPGEVRTVAPGIRSAQMEMVVVDRPREADGSPSHHFSLIPRSWLGETKAHYQGLLDALDKDGPLVPLPKREAPAREFKAQPHDFLAALHRQYTPPV